MSTNPRNKIEIMRKKNNAIKKTNSAIINIKNIAQEDLYIRRTLTKPIYTVDNHNFSAPFRYFSSKAITEREKDYYDNLIRKSKEYNGTPIISDNNISSTILLHYLYFKKNVTAIVIWPITNMDITPSNFLYKELEKYGTIHGIIKLELTFFEMQNFIYQVYFNNNYIKTMEKLKGKTTKVSSKSSKSNKITVIFYETRQEINGKNAKFKQHLRGVVQRKLKTNVLSNILLHATDNFTEMIELARLVCNENSLKLLGEQQIGEIIKNTKIMNIFLTIKYHIYSNLNLYQQDNILFNRGFIDFSIGFPVDDLLITQRDNVIEPSKVTETDKKLKYYDPANYYFLGMKFKKLE